jgi:glycosyltransferase involved in cell wall biosynthesis
MPDLPRICLVTPSYNTGAHIEESIRSVLDQDYKNVDYLVMDGGSADNTLDVLLSFGDRIRWTSQKDNGQADAIHRGFGQTTGEILGWLNADDSLAPGALRTVAEFFAAHPDVALVYGNAQYIGVGGDVIGPCVHVEPFNAGRLFHYSDFIAQPAAFFRRSAYEAVGGFDTSLHYSMDYDLWLKFAKQFKIVYLPITLANYRWLTDNKTATGGIRRVDELTELCARHGFAQPAYIRLERVNLHLRDAIGALRCGGVWRAVRSSAKAFTTLVASPRAMISMFQPHTWRIIWMGQVLRARAVRAKKKSELTQSGNNDKCRMQNAE